jgi:hypothetical protein
MCGIGTTRLVVAGGEVRCSVSTEIALDDAIGPRTCSLECPLEASMRMIQWHRFRVFTLLPVEAVQSVRTLKVLAPAAHPRPHHQHRLQGKGESRWMIVQCSFLDRSVCTHSRSAIASHCCWDKSNMRVRVIQ